MCTFVFTGVFFVSTGVGDIVGVSFVSTDSLGTFDGIGDVDGFGISLEVRMDVGVGVERFEIFLVGVEGTGIDRMGVEGIGLDGRGVECFEEFLEGSTSKGIRDVEGLGEVFLLITSNFSLNK